MRVWDSHCHLRGDEKGDDVLRYMDAAGIERITAFSTYPFLLSQPQKDGKLGWLEPFDCSGNPRGDGLCYKRDDVRAAIEHTAAVQAADPSRIFGLLWAEPRVEGMLEEIEYGINDRGLRGLKMIPNQWEPCDEIVLPIYEKLEELGKPVHFHSGILYVLGSSSRFCRPVLFEPLMHFPKLKFALAHMSWPWVDECIAVYGRFRTAAGFRQDPPTWSDTDHCQMWIDTTRGTPDLWRVDALQKALVFCGGMDHVMFGVDNFPPGLPETGPVSVRKDLDILKNMLGATQEQIDMFFWGAAEKFFAD